MLHARPRQLLQVRVAEVIVQRSTDIFMCKLDAAYTFIVG